MYRLIDYPEPRTPLQYEEAVERMTDQLIRLDGLVSVYRIGGVSTPGISDLDMVAVFEDGQSCQAQLRDDLDPGDRYLFIHDLFGTSETLFQNAQRVSFFRNYEKLWGRDQPVLDSPDQLEDGVETQMAMEYLVKMVVNLAVQQSFGVLKVRSLLLHVKALGYDMDHLGVTGGPLFEAIGDMIQIRNTWLDQPVARRDLSIAVDRLSQELNGFLNDQLRSSPLSVPVGGRIKVGRNIELMPSDRIEVNRKGLMLPRSMSLLGRRFFALSHRLSRLEIGVPMEVGPPTQGVATLFDVAGSMHRYNQKNLPHFMPLTSSLGLQ